MYTIGVTGKSGSGKSYLAKKLQELLYPKKVEYVDVDKIGHQVTDTEEVKEQLEKHFGKLILQKSGKVDRKQLGKIVFSDEKEMAFLTEVTWKTMKKMLQEKLNQDEMDYLILDWALLPKGEEIFQACNMKILVLSDSDRRKERILKRDAITPEYFDRRERASMTYELKEFQYLIQNNSTLEEFERQINQLADKALKY